MSASTSPSPANTTPPVDDEKRTSDASPTASNATSLISNSLSSYMTAVQQKLRDAHKNRSTIRPQHMVRMKIADDTVELLEGGWARKLHVKGFPVECPPALDWLFERQEGHDSLVTLDADLQTCQNYVIAKTRQCAPGFAHAVEDKPWLCIECDVFHDLSTFRIPVKTRDPTVRFIQWNSAVLHVWHAHQCAPSVEFARFVATYTARLPGNRKLSVAEIDQCAPPTMVKVYHTTNSFDVYPERWRYVLHVDLLLPPIYAVYTEGGFSCEPLQTGRHAMKLSRFEDGVQTHTRLIDALTVVENRAGVQIRPLVINPKDRNGVLPPSFFVRRISTSEQTVHCQICDKRLTHRQDYAVGAIVDTRPAILRWPDTFAHYIRDHRVIVTTTFMNVVLTCAMALASHEHAGRLIDRIGAAVEEERNAKRIPADVKARFTIEVTKPGASSSAAAAAKKPKKPRPRVKKPKDASAAAASADGGGPKPKPKPKPKPRPKPSDKDGKPSRPAKSPARVKKNRPVVAGVVRALSSVPVDDV
jgi:hypothetical protein